MKNSGYAWFVLFYDDEPINAPFIPGWSWDEVDLKSLKHYNKSYFKDPELLTWAKVAQPGDKYEIRKEGIFKGSVILLRELY